MSLAHQPVLPKHVENLGAKNNQKLKKMTRGSKARKIKLFSYKFLIISPIDILAFVPKDSFLLNLVAVFLFLNLFFPFLCEFNWIGMRSMIFAYMKLYLINAK